MAVEELNTIEEEEVAPKQTAPKKKAQAKKAAAKADQPIDDGKWNDRLVSVYIPVDPTIKDNFKIASVNGRFYTIRRGEWVDRVPLAVAEVLRESEKNTRIAADFIAGKERQ